MDLICKGSFGIKRNCWFDASWLTAILDVIFLCRRGEAYRPVCGKKRPPVSYSTYEQRAEELSVRFSQVRKSISISHYLNFPSFFEPVPMTRLHYRGMHRNSQKSFIGKLLGKLIYLRWEVLYGLRGILGKSVGKKENIKPSPLGNLIFF
jgi:hypothetical protein